MSARTALTSAVAALRAGRPVLVSDDPDREDEADLILPALDADAGWVGFLVRHSSGVLCAPMPRERAQALELPPMVSSNQDPKGTAYTVSCDAAGLSTGIGASERALTLQALASRDAAPDSLTRPGHVFPLVAHPEGLAGRRGHTEAGVELVRLAGLGEVAVIAELVGEDGEVLRGAEVDAFALRHDLVHLGLDDIARGTQEARRAAEAAGWGPWAQLPSTHGALRASAYGAPGQEVVWIEAAAGLAAEAGRPPLVRLHSECVTSESFGSLRCDCREQLEQALDLAGGGLAAVLHLRGHEGRGIGLAAKLHAYQLQDGGADTVQANRVLGYGDDERDYGAAAAALRSRGISEVRLLSNNPAKAAALAAAGVNVSEIVPTVTVRRPQADTYLETKHRKMGHLMNSEQRATLAPASNAAAGGVA